MGKMDWSGNGTEMEIEGNDNKVFGIEVNDTKLQFQLFGLEIKTSEREQYCTPPPPLLFNEVLNDIEVSYMQMH